MRAVLRIRREPYYRRAAFEQGLKRVGFVLDDKLTKPAGPEDWLCLWNRQNDGEREADNWERFGGTVVIAENGYLQKVDKTYYALSVHGHNNSGWHPVGDEDRFSKLGFEIKPWQDNPHGHVLVCGQRGIGSRTMKSPPQWAERMAQRIGKIARVRSHPGNGKPRTPITIDLKGARACVVWSSAAGVQALVEGVPVLYAAPHWVCAIGARRIEEFPLTLQSNAARSTALARMAWGQWHHEEIAQGTPFARIIEHRKEAIW